jgi:hypothetical protein
VDVLDYRSFGPLNAGFRGRLQCRRIIGKAAPWG